MALIGTVVHWKHLKEDGSPALNIEGEIVATAAAGAKFLLLLQLSTGEFKAVDADCVAEGPFDEAPVTAVALVDGGACALAEYIKNAGFGDETTDKDPCGQAMRLIAEAINDLKEMQMQLDAAGGGDERITQLAAENKKLSDEIAELRAAAAKKGKKGKAE